MADRLVFSPMPWANAPTSGYALTAHPIDGPDWCPACELGARLARQTAWAGRISPEAEYHDGEHLARWFEDPVHSVRVRITVPVRALAWLNAEDPRVLITEDLPDGRRGTIAASEFLTWPRHTEAVA